MQYCRMDGEAAVNQKTSTMRSLTCKHLHLQRPIQTTVTRIASGNFVARAPQLTLLLSAKGRTRSVALRRLASGIATQYSLLASMPRQEQAAIHRKMLRSLRRFVEEAKIETNPARSRSEVRSKARIRKG